MITRAESELPEDSAGFLLELGIILLLPRRPIKIAFCVSQIPCDVSFS